MKHPLVTLSPKPVEAIVGHVLVIHRRMLSKRALIIIHAQLPSIHHVVLWLKLVKLSMLEALVGALAVA